MMGMIEEIDKEDMTAMVDAFPSLLQIYSLSEEYQKKLEHIDKTSIKGIGLVGMGGSAISGLLSKGLLDQKSHIPIVSVQDYKLPKYIQKKWVVIAVSYSGNTEETLASLKEGQGRGCTCLGITSGGKLRNKLPSEQIQLLPKGLQPRAALPIIFAAVYPTIQLLIGTDKEDLVKVGRKLEELEKDWGGNITPVQFAKSISNSIPLFTGWSHLSPVAYRARCQINENAKTAAYNSDIPEANHNEIESCESFSKYRIIPVFLRSIYEETGITRRFEITGEIYRAQGISPLEIRFEELSQIEETLVHTYYLDKVSVELAKILKADPISVDRISTLKRKLASSDETH
ncbi:MAG: hypothetical protein BAJATHORv1_10099 [Candidatus Thorarchaeota archaeon]|nr:MAG: hypothetical protein BAJATHORv1_10099 [Candidatus Thorarchaeota archaeon]